MSGWVRSSQLESRQPCSSEVKSMSATRGSSQVHRTTSPGSRNILPFELRRRGEVEGDGDLEVEQVQGDGRRLVAKVEHHLKESEPFLVA